jgi:hypothetical protein
MDTALVAVDPVKIFFARGIIPHEMGTRQGILIAAIILNQIQSFAVEPVSPLLDANLPISGLRQVLQNLSPTNARKFRED